MVLTKQRITGRSSVVILSIAVMAVSFLSGCAGSGKSVVDRQYQKIVEQQQLRSEVADEPDIEKWLSPADAPGTLEERGDAYLRTGNPGMAFLEYGKALKADPNRTGTRRKLANLMLKRKMWADAIREFDTINRQSPEDPQALEGKAAALMQLGRLKEAEDALNAAIAVDTGLWHAYALLGIVYDRQRRHGPAIEAYEKAVAINPGAAAVYNNLGISLYMSGRYRESADILLKSIRLGVSSPGAYNNLGLALFKIGMFPEALEAFRKGGDDASAYNNMGVLYMEAGQYARSIEFFEKAIEARPSYYESAYAGLKKARAALGPAAAREGMGRRQ